MDIHFFKPYKGTKDMVADLIEKQPDGTVRVRVGETEETLNLKDISQIRLHIDF